VKLLLVGDPHVTVEELGDSQALLDFVYRLAQDKKPDAVVFLGDLHHNHALVRVEVTDFWLRNLTKFATTKFGQSFGLPMYLILGNHDRPNDASSTSHALQPYSHLARVVDAPVPLGDVLLVPYYHSPEEMVRAVIPYKAKTLICHQTFSGSVYENGFPAPDGVDPILLGIPNIVSGHIHTAQTVSWPSGDIRYIGSPRWRTQSDANLYKCVEIYDTETGMSQKFDTSEVCSPLSLTTVSSVGDLEKVAFRDVPHARHRIDVLATKADIEQLVKEIRFRFPKARIRPIPTDTAKRSRVTESEGVTVALRRFVEGFESPFGTPKDHLKELIAQRLSL
jgi:DNA repair exonuclease SbcCD nuclease subunit